MKKINKEEHDRFKGEECFTFEALIILDEFGTFNFFFGSVNVSNCI